ncbi:hypothetical protein ACIPK7_05425 [Pseudomonas sp. NPDC086581]|uniref:hypothetical protein n=1 Tax=Pseudomonas sp. NPDC086581 TaxID=3364432 RepID=UPI00382AD794
MSLKYPHRDEGISVAERVLYAVKEKVGNQQTGPFDMKQNALDIDRLTRYVGLLTETLIGNGRLTEDQAMDLLDRVVDGRKLHEN